MIFNIKCMAHIIYQTEGIILGKSDFGEANRFYHIFTKEFGMINAIAQGTRYAKSKLRCNLDLFSCASFSLIAGKSAGGLIWRVIDAQENESSVQLAADSDKLKTFARIANFLIRMLKGEEKNTFIWEEIKNLFSSLSAGDEQNKNLRDLEIAAMAGILSNLGYMSDIPSSKSLLITAINRAIKESML